MGYDKFLDVNPVDKKFDSGTLWTNAQMIPSADGKTQYLYYGAYEAWNVDVSGNGASGVGVAKMGTNRFAAVTPMNSSYPSQVPQICTAPE